MSDMSEIECFEHFAEGLKRASAGARAIFTHRRDQPEWLQYANLMENVLRTAHRLETMRRRPSLILMPN
jgi:hypothetical protein